MNMEGSAEAADRGIVFWSKMQSFYKKTQFPPTPAAKFVSWGRGEDRRGGQGSRRAYDAGGSSRRQAAATEIPGRGAVPSIDLCG